MVKIDIISGFLGAGKTTLIKKLLEEKAFGNERVVLIENEFGEIGIDGTLLKGFDIEIKEMNSGCICCTIAGDFSQALKEMMKMYQPERIIIEPSGVGKLSDVIKGCQKFVQKNEVELNICITVIDGLKYKMYMKNFAEFYKDQLVNAKTIILSRTLDMSQAAFDYVIHDIRNYNKKAPIITNHWNDLSAQELVFLTENTLIDSFEKRLLNEVKQKRASVRGMTLDAKKITGVNQKVHHHADEIFEVWSRETTQVFEQKELSGAIGALDHLVGQTVLRAKGIVKTNSNKWLQFDYVPGECVIRETSGDFTGRICVIGENINRAQISKLFGL